MLLSGSLYLRGHERAELCAYPPLVGRALTLRQDLHEPRLGAFEAAVFVRPSGHRLTDPLRHALADVQLARDPVHPQPGATQLVNSPRNVVGRDRPTEALTLSSGAIKPGPGPFDQHRALELGKYARHTEQCTTSGRCRVY